MTRPALFFSDAMLQSPPAQRQRARFGPVSRASRKPASASHETFGDHASSDPRCFKARLGTHL